MVVLCVTRNWFNICMIGPSNGLNVPAACLVPYGNLTRDCSGNRLVKLVFRPLFGLACWYLSCSLGLTTCRMFWSYGENSYRRRLGWLGNYRTCFYSPIGFI
jgi:hypothetical protein